jgi:peptide/nickel transport system permease protein
VSRSACNRVTSGCNASILLISLTAIDFGTLFVGIISIETIFTLNGKGFYLVNCLQVSDPYPVMAWPMVVTFNSIADILYGAVDPRIRYD